SVLWALGAEVTTVVDAASAHRRGRPRVGCGDEATSLLAVSLDRGKHVVAADDLAAVEALLQAGTDSAPFDVVVVDRVLGTRGALAAVRDVVDYPAFVGRHNRAGWVTISAFGLTGARADDVATEITVAAAGGMLSAVRDERTGQPLKLAGQQSLLN